MARPIDVNNPDHPRQVDVIQLAGHVYHGNGFRSRPVRVEGSPVLIGRIPDRHEIFNDDETPPQ